MALLQPPSQGAAPTAPQDPQFMEEGPVADTVEAELENNDASPEEQQAYDEVVLAGLRVLYTKGEKGEEGTHEHVMGMINSGSDPATTLARITALIIKDLDQQMGNAIPETVILPASMEIMDAVAEMAEAAGAFTIDADTAEVALDILVTDLGEAYNVDPEQIRLLLDQFDDEELAYMGEEASRNAHAWTPV